MFDRSILLPSPPNTSPLHLPGADSQANSAADAIATALPRPIPCQLRDARKLLLVALAAADIHGRGGRLAGPQSSCTSCEAILTARMSEPSRSPSVSCVLLEKERKCVHVLQGSCACTSCVRCLVLPSADEGRVSGLGGNGPVQCRVVAAGESQRGLFRLGAQWRSASEISHQLCLRAGLLFLVARRAHWRPGVRGRRGGRGRSARPVDRRGLGQVGEVIATARHCRGRADDGCASSGRFQGVGSTATLQPTMSGLRKQHD